MSNQTPRTAVVTGAARGIGAAVARRLGADGFGVAVLDVDEGAAKPVAVEMGRGGWWG
ncbi:SDR family NAD(P)-dependent oxidoreductase, partial [Nocardia xishanensis]